MPLNLYSSMKKKNNKKIWMNFDIENWLWKSQFGTFWNLCYTNLQNSMISFDYSWFLAKTFLILYPYLGNSTTGIAIRYRISLKQKNICQMTAITNCNVLIISRFFFFRSEQLIKSNKFKCFKRYYKMKLPRFAL